MPYAANRDIPEGVRSALPAAAQTVWRTAYNGAAQRGDQDEPGRMRIAWGAVRRAGYRRPADGGKWVKKLGVDQALTDMAIDWRHGKAERTYKPPQSVRNNARRGLQLRQQFGRGGTATGIARARDLANGKGIPVATLRRMRAFFERHEGNKDTPPSEGNGQIAWLLWGGDAGRRWVNARLREAGELEKVDVGIAKLDEDKQLAYGWLYVSRRKDGSQVVDHSGEVVSIEELEKAATAYALDHREAKEMHTGGSAGRLVEIWVSTPEKRAAMGIPDGILPDGIWVGYKVDDTGTWKKIRSGQLKMFSLGGRALRQALKLLKEAHDAQAV